MVEPSDVSSCPILIELPVFDDMSLGRTIDQIHRNALLMKGAKQLHALSRKGVRTGETWTNADQGRRTDPLREQQWRARQVLMLNLRGVAAHVESSQPSLVR